MSPRAGGLLGSGFRLRPERRFPSGFYRFALVSNAFARLGWAVYVSPHQTVVAQQLVLLLGVVELLRRFQWTLLRVEWEGIRNRQHRTAPPLVSHRRTTPFQLAEEETYS